MPKSKRARVVPTSKTSKNRKELVKRLHSNIQAAVESYAYIWVFEVQNMRNSSIKDVRSQLNDCRLFMGKTKLMVHALGSTVETEHAPGLRLLTPYLSGEIGLLFTIRAPEEIEGYFADFRSLDFARAGTKAAQGFTIPRGELRTSFGVEGGEDDLIPIGAEPTLRKLGVPTRIVKGKVVLEESGDVERMEEEEGYVVCRQDETLDSRQTALLKMFGVRMAEFKVGLRAVWEKAGGTVREVGGMGVEGMEES
jgi:mRNA turnover protein 4